MAHPAPVPLSIPDVALRLDVSETTVKRLIKSGQLAHFKIGRLTKVDPRDVEQFIESRRHLGVAS